MRPSGIYRNSPLIPVAKKMNTTPLISYAPLSNVGFIHTAFWSTSAAAIFNNVVDVIVRVTTILKKNNNHMEA
ncbi:hypothetical protein CW304_15220 [Bacillus sp. UFRGS-B20]|nr:hypothetical protein CW304_15220 [Bacillus sp. UFRGS-B20]